MWLFPSNEYNSEITFDDVVILIHLHYVDTLFRCYTFIDNIPKGIFIYITTSVNEVYNLIDERYRYIENMTDKLQEHGFTRYVYYHERDESK